MAFLNIFSKNKIKQKENIIIADNREKNSLVISELIKLNNKVQFEQLQIGDYLVNNIAIERKTSSDLASSIIDKRIISQLQNLKTYPNHLIILENNNNRANINENALRGFLLSIALKFKVPIIYTKDEKDTAKYLSILANKKEKKESSLRPSKILQSSSERIQFILEGLPNIGPVKAKQLIANFKTIRNIANANIDELEKVLGKQAKDLHNLFNQEFQL